VGDGAEVAGVGDHDAGEGSALAVREDPSLSPGHLLVEQALDLAVALVWVDAPGWEPCGVRRWPRASPALGELSKPSTENPPTWIISPGSSTMRS